MVAVSLPRRIAVATVGVTMLGPSVAVADPAGTAVATPPASTGWTPEPAQPFPLTAGGGERFTPASLLPPADGRGWVLAGAYQAAPGERTQVAVYEADAHDPTGWQMVATSDEPGPVVVNAATRTVDGDVIVVGAVQHTDETSPLLLSYDGTTLHHLPITEAAADDASILDATAADDGSLWLLVRRASDVASHQVARRLPDHSWTIADLDHEWAHHGVSGIAAAGGTAVVTGAAILADGPGHSVPAWHTSTDGGASFGAHAEVSLGSERVGTHFGEAIVVPADTGSGRQFVTSACVEVDGVRQPRIARSDDGAGWQLDDIDPADAAAVWPYVVSADCSALAGDVAGGIWIVASQDGFVNYLRYRAGTVDRVATESDWGELGRFSWNSLVAVSDGLVATIVHSTGGVTSAFTPVAGIGGPAAPTELDNGVNGLVPPGEEVNSVFFLDDDGQVPAVETWPHMVPQSDGSYTAQSRLHPYELDTAATPTSAPHAAPIDPATGGAMKLIVSTDAGDIALHSTTDDPGTPDEYRGLVGDIVVARRGPGGTWTSSEILLGGYAQQAVHDAIAFGDGVLIIGESSFTQPENGIVYGRPLVLLTDAAATTFEELPLELRAEYAYIASVCWLDDQRALAIGWNATTARSFTVVIDVDTRQTIVQEPQLDAARWLQGCLTTHDGVVVATGRDAGGGDVVYTTIDGLVFDEVDLLGPADGIATVRANEHGVVIAGAGGPFRSDAFVLVGPSIHELERVERPEFLGPGHTWAADADLRADSLVVLGVDNGAPVVWPFSRSDS